MHRRLFAKLVAAGLGSLSLVQDEARGEDSRGPEAIPDAGVAAASNRISSLQHAVTTEDLAVLARAKLPRATYDYIAGGSEDEVTLRDNVAAFRRIRVLPPVLRGVAETDLSATVLGERIAMPVLLAPVAALRMYHPEGALACARAATQMGTVCAVSSSAFNSVEEIGQAAPGPKWLQLYVPRDRSVARRLIERAETAGYRALIVTVDLGERKDRDLRNAFTIPRDILLKHLRDIGFDGLSDGIPDEQLLEFNRQAWDLALSWKFLDWLRSTTKLPILVKGILTPADARQAVAAGANGIVVSNHGGRRLDGMPASIDCLPAVVEAVDGRAEVLLDSGIRRGGDVLKALALGAKAVLIGRPYAWGLAAGGQPGVEHTLTILRDELTNAMLACGCRNVGEIDRSLLITG